MMMRLGFAVSASARGPQKHKPRTTERRRRNLMGWKERCADQSVEGD
jgi:hypothetical protein